MRKLLFLLLAGALLLMPMAALADDSLPPPPPDSPTSSIVDPTDGATLNGPLPILIKGIAADYDGVMKVEVVIKGASSTSTYLASPTKANYAEWEFAWRDAAAGSYTLVSIATDRYTLTQEDSTRKPVSVTVSLQSTATPTADTYPPPLVISEPPFPAYQVTTPTYTIRGQTEPGATLTINGNSVQVGADGSFDYPVTLNTGNNTFALEVKDAAGNSTKMDVTLAYGASPSPTPTPSSPTPSPTPTPSPSPSPTPGGLPDLTGHWAEAVIRSLVAKGIISGYPDGTFQPDRPITRAEFCTILAKALGLAPSPDTHQIVDLGEHWAAGYVYTLVDKGYIKGYPDGTFKPDAPIKRAEIATIISRVKSLSIVPDRATFSDVEPTYWAFNAIEACAASKIMSGYPDGTFKPEQQATRAESAVVIARALGL